MMIMTVIIAITTLLMGIYYDDGAAVNAPLYPTIIDNDGFDDDDGDDYGGGDGDDDGGGDGDDEDEDEDNPMS